MDPVNIICVCDCVLSMWKHLDDSGGTTGNMGEFYPKNIFLTPPCQIAPQITNVLKLDQG